MADEQHIERKFYSLNPRDFQHLPLKQWDEVGTAVFHQARMMCGYSSAPNSMATIVSDSHKSVSDFDFNRIHRKLNLTIESDELSSRSWRRGVDPFQQYLDIVKCAYSKNSSHYGIADFVIESTLAVPGEMKKIRFVNDRFFDILRSIFSCRFWKTSTKQESYIESLYESTYLITIRNDSEIADMNLEWTQPKRVRDWCMDIDKRKLRHCGIPAIEMHGNGSRVFDEIKIHLDNALNKLEFCGLKVVDPYS